jgi:hypothetical protein
MLVFSTSLEFEPGCAFCVLYGNENCVWLDGVM